MMTDAPDRIPLDTARRIGQRVSDALSLICPRALTAGSTRRESPTVKDVEVVYQVSPTTGAFFNLIERGGHIQKATYPDGRVRWGPTYYGFILDGVRVEAFGADAENWGYQLLLRTGPGDGNKELMYRISKTLYRFSEGYLWWSESGNWSKNKKDQWVAADRRRVRLAEEVDLFGVMGIDYVLPPDRTPAMYQTPNLFKLPPPERMLCEMEVQQMELI